VELVVSIGILALMLTLAGKVFTLTSESTGLATGYTEVSQALRAMERTIRADLQAVQPGSSLMVIRCQPVNAYWKESHRLTDTDTDPSNGGFDYEADPEREEVFGAGSGALDPPRADTLMFFTSTEATSTRFPLVRSNVQQVVYGHAVLGEYAPVGARFEFEPDMASFPPVPEPSRVPAQTWHLARRNIILTETNSPLDPDTNEPIWARTLVEDGEYNPDLSILKGSADVVGGFVYEQQVLTPPRKFVDAHPWHLPSIFPIGPPYRADQVLPYARSRLDLTPPAALGDRLGQFFLPHCASFKVEWTLDAHGEFVGGRLDGERDVLWIDQGDMESNPFRAWETAIQQALDRGDTRRASRLQSVMRDPTGGESQFPYSLQWRFRDFVADPDWPSIEEDGGARTVVFNATRRLATEEIAQDEIFPAALRITVDVYDGAGRLDRPVRHVMVIPVGQ
jgi:type II secretory pathway pseudopilin PulG